MAEHTKGEWFWTEDKWGQLTSLRCSGSGDVVLDAQADTGDYGLSVRPYIDISEANARLTAAAPELLEALKEAVDDLRTSYRFRGGGWECSEDELVGKYVVLIAKAEGK